MFDLFVQTWDGLVENFEKRLDAYRCSKDHSAAPESCESELWEVELHFFDYNRTEQFSSVLLCSSRDIAVEEAVDLLWSDPCGAFYETDHIFDDEVTDLAERYGAVKKLEEMRQTLRHIVQCSSCYESMGDDGFRDQDGRQKVLVQPAPARDVITKKRKLGRRNDGTKE
jgi:hypothetical protein